MIDTPSSAPAQGEPVRQDGFAGHTPGPWIYKIVWSSEQERLLPESEWSGLYIGPESDEPPGTILHTIFEGGFTHRPNDGNPETDARLLAAAPTLAAENARLREELYKAKSVISYLCDSVTYSDSYGVENSSFTCCRLCSGGGAPGVPFAHDPDCPTQRLEEIADQYWEEQKDVLAELAVNDCI